MKAQYDVVILGAGHNGLVAASYLGQAGLSVLLLEKNNYIGGATTSQKLFPDYDAQLSRYSYLVSLFPEKIIRDLGLNVELRRRATASFTPYLNHGEQDGLLLSNVDEEISRQSMFELTGNHTEFEQMKAFYNLSRVFAERVWDTMLEPLIAKEEFRRPDASARSVALTESLFHLSSHRQQDRGMEGADRRHGCGRVGAGAGSAQSWRRNTDKCRPSRTRPGREAADGWILHERRTANRRSAVPSGKLWPKCVGEVRRQTIPTGCHGRRLGVQDQHAPATIAEVESEKVSLGSGVVRHVSQRRKLRANECQLRSSMQRAAAEQNTVRSLLPHINRRQHSCARVARKRFPYHDVVRTGCAVEFVRAR